ncbi:hypothetical protein PVAP13_6KG007701 [Panicum virgatum]|uniref:Uncharacterized protein n=1 Tax=Panicum virgatum TaxID=38727 RepID=A0A8T0R7Z4_PANVG|nr:hypothetical protein PVAP13_6KG007701 [Panicum virgatum]
MGASCHQPDPPPPSSGPVGRRRRLPFFKSEFPHPNPNPPHPETERERPRRERERDRGERDGPVQHPRSGVQDAGRDARPPPPLLRRLPPRPRAGDRRNCCPPQAEQARGDAEGWCAAPDDHQLRRHGALRLCRYPTLSQQGAPPRAAD